MKKVLATGIGSLPHQDVDKALDLIFEYTPKVPFWPQLPRRDIREGMIAQFSENLPCVRLKADGLFFDSQQKEKELEVFYEHIISNDINYFNISQNFALGLHKFYQRLEEQESKDLEFIKCQVTGPFTFAASIKDDRGIPLLHDAVFMQAVLKGLLMKALWQINLFKKFNKNIILFFDEPYLGCFGSAYTPINREDVVNDLSEFGAGIKSQDILLGVHCCGNTDWSIFTDINSLDIISFDAFSFQEKFVLYSDNLKDFFRRGGLVCWGIIPTQDFVDSQTPDILIDKIKAGISILLKKGLDKELLLERLLLSPSCGLASLDVEKSNKIFKLLFETQEKLIDSLAYFS